MGSSLHETLHDRRDEIMRQWQVIVQGTIIPDTMGHAEMIDHLPSFLEEIIAALRLDAGLPSEAPAPADSDTASGHGVQRLRLGFSLDAVVREYGALRDAIVSTAAAAGCIFVLELPTFASS